MKREVEFARDHPCFAGHFPGNPVVPGAVLLDEALDFAGTVVGDDSATPPEVLRAKFPAPVGPGQVCVFRTDGVRDGTLRIDCIRDGILAMSSVFRVPGGGRGDD
jgi:3-hydroxymyristoyl/3-hydroxydecanoyl-(acyl carrier protein) dehydratase